MKNKEAKNRNAFKLNKYTHIRKYIKKTFTNLLSDGK